MKFFRNYPLLVVLLLCATILASFDVSAFDGERKGFILGIGIGPGFTSFKQTVTFGSSSESGSESKFGFQTDFKIGYAPSNNLEIYYSNKVSWIGIENLVGDNITIADGLSSVAMSYFFEEEGPSPFLSGGLGLAAWNPVFEEEASVSRGFGLFVGGGYEFARHWDVSGNLVWGNPTTTESGLKLSTNSLTFQVTINFMAY